MFKVLVTAPYMQRVIERFRPELERHNIQLVVPPVQERLEEEELLKWIADIDGVMCGDDRFTARVLDASPKLKVISKWGTGIDSIDAEACERLGIAVRRTVNAFSEPVADSIIGYVLCFSRYLPWMDKAMKQGQWKKIYGVALRELTLGIIGVGNVGKALVRRARGFGMRVLGNDIVEMPRDFVESSGIEMVSKERLLKESDYVSLNCDLNPTTYHLMSSGEFQTMKPEAVVVNAARGPIIDELALIRALQNKEIRGAALDVFETEPLPADSPLLSMDNVMLAPHNANNSPEAWENVHRKTIEHLLDVLERQGTGPRKAGMAL